MIIQYLFSAPQIFLVWILAIVYAITVHEFSHALVSWRLGDPTARNQGRLSLNPFAHLDPLGSLMLVLVGFGWGKPVPFDPLYLRNRRWGPALISMAGPFANIVSIILFGFVLKLVVGGGVVAQDSLLTLFLVALIQINIVLALFNFIPIPPLDGSKLLYALLPDRYMNFKIALERRGPVVLLVLILLSSFLPVSIFGAIFSPVIDWVLKLFS